MRPAWRLPDPRPQGIASSSRGRGIVFEALPSLVKNENTPLGSRTSSQRTRTCALPQSRCRNVDLMSKRLGIWRTKAEARRLTPGHPKFAICYLLFAKPQAGPVKHRSLWS